MAAMLLRHANDYTAFTGEDAMAEIRTVEFNSLPKAARERFVAITRGTAGPAPALAEKTATGSKVLGLAFLAAMLAALALGVAAVGFGDWYNAYPIHGPALVAFGYVPLFFLLVLVLVVIAHRVLRGSPFPFLPGRYLFATDFVDARTGKLRIVPTALLTDFKGTHMHTNNSYTHTQLAFVFGQATEQFGVRGKEAAEAATKAFWDGQKALAAAAQAEDWDAVVKLDPFAECRRTGSWEGGSAADGGPRVKAIAPFFRWRFAIAAVVAIVLCPLIALGRNWASDEAMFATAKRVDSEDGWGRYIDHGWRRIPEAKLAQPIAAFREAKKDATVSKMRRVLKKYPGSSIAADARAALHGLYMKTLADFRQRASTADVRLLPFMARLIDYLEKNDTATVRVVFSAPSTSALAQADALFQREYSRGGRIVEPISPYFGGTSSSPREQAIVSRLNSAFASIFPTDVLRLERGESAAIAKEPSLAIAYVVGPSGRAYSSDDQQRIFVGIDVAFGMRMRIPNDSSQLDFQLKVSPPARFGYRYTKGGNQAEAAYNAMAERAFDEFNAKLQGVFFRK
jgi:hypothetical protein